MITFEKGIKLKGIPFWLDSPVRRDMAFVSHPHSDHAASHNIAILSRESSKLFSLRYRSFKMLTLPWRKPVKIGKLRVTLLPSGHMLGSAQILIEHHFRVLYSGDFKIRKNLTARRIEFAETDVLIMDATYGHPSFVFPPEDKIFGQVLDFIRECWADRIIPVLFAYSLGKAQELMARLGRESIEVRVHPRIKEAADIYSSLGINFGKYKVFTGEEKGEFVVIYPPSSRKNRIFQNIPVRTALVSGWALRSKGSFDVGFPLSDHADYQELIRYVEEIDPVEVYLIRGSDHLKMDLEKRGYTVHKLPLPKQLKLF